MKMQPFSGCLEEMNQFVNEPYLSNIVMDEVHTLHTGTSVHVYESSVKGEYVIDFYKEGEPVYGVTVTIGETGGTFENVDLTKISANEIHEAIGYLVRRQASHEIEPPEKNRRMDKEGMEKIPETLPIPWHWDNTDLTIQLKKEIPTGHLLSGKKVRSVGRRQDNDDALFEIDSDEYKYAVVHLTWAQKKLKDPKYPTTKLYKDWNDLYVNRILRDKEDWDELEKSGL